MLTFIDLFAGVGGFRRGMELAGHKCVGFCEWDKYATMSYTAMHLMTEEQREYMKTLSLRERQKELMNNGEKYRNGEWYSNDIRTVNAGNIPKCDVWCFGAPCQDFSVAGKRAGLDGGRSSLVREVFRMLGEIEEENRPEWIIYENVKGMFSSNKGFDYLEILIAMDELGYDVEWQLFNSKDYGVPQNRERVYTIGHLRRYGGRKILPITGSRTENNIRQIGRKKSNRGWDNPSTHRVYDKKGLSPNIVTNGGGGHEPYIVASTITPDGIKKGIRKLTPREYFRLQGWEDKYFDNAQLVNSDSQLYKQGGNGVTVNVVYEIAKKMEV